MEKELCLKGEDWIDRMEWQDGIRVEEENKGVGDFIGIRFLEEEIL